MTFKVNLIPLMIVTVLLLIGCGENHRPNHNFSRQYTNDYYNNNHNESLRITFKNLRLKSRYDEGEAITLRAGEKFSIVGTVSYSNAVNFIEFTIFVAKVETKKIGVLGTLSNNNLHGKATTRKLKISDIQTDNTKPGSYKIELCATKVRDYDDDRVLEDDANNCAEILELIVY